jgi:hypothetical protein
VSELGTRLRRPSWFARLIRKGELELTDMIGLLKACDLLPRKLLVTAIKAIKHLSTSPQLIEVLQNSNAMEILVALLGKSIKGTHANVRPVTFALD